MADDEVADVVDVVDDGEAGTDGIEDDGGGGRRPAGPGWRFIGMAAALVFLAGAFGLWLGRAEAGAPSPADVGFLRDMVVHHDQAVGMSLAVLDSPLPAAVRPYAQEIVVAQRYEMGLMEGTLRAWGEDTEGDGTAMAWMGHPTPASAMPGLATDEEMEALARAAGDEAGALWIALMTRHHLAGAEMAEAAVDRVEDGFVRRIAARMARNQRLEVEEYEAVRARLGLPVVPLGEGAAGGHTDH